MTDVHSGSYLQATKLAALKYTALALSRGMETHGRELVPTR